jgi:hypothetical protein
MSSGKPTREQADLAEVLELVLDKGIVINADVAVTVGETELLGIELRAAIASFETAAKYGLAFPSGTDMRRVERASGRERLEGDEAEPVDLGIDASSRDEENADDDGEGDGETVAATPVTPGQRPTPAVPTGDDGDDDDADSRADDAGESEADGDETGADDASGTTEPADVKSEADRAGDAAGEDEVEGENA